MWEQKEGKWNGSLWKWLIMEMEGRRKDRRGIMGNNKKWWAWKKAKREKENTERKKGEGILEGEQNRCRIEYGYKVNRLKKRRERNIGFTKENTNVHNKKASIKCLSRYRPLLTPQSTLTTCCRAHPYREHWDPPASVNSVPPTPVSVPKYQTSCPAKINRISPAYSIWHQLGFLSRQKALLFGLLRGFNLLFSCC